MRGSNAGSRGAYNAYELYSAIRLHFTTEKYNAVTYNFKSKISGSSFEKRTDKFFFDKISKQYNSREKMIEFFVYNFVDDKPYVGEMLESTYFKHKKIKESIHRIFAVDLQWMKDCNTNFDSLLQATDGQHPLVIQLWLQEEICLETVVILNSMFGFVEREDKRISDNILWPELKMKIEKFQPFVKFDEDKCKTLLRREFQ